METDYGRELLEAIVYAMQSFDHMARGIERVHFFENLTRGEFLTLCVILRHGEEGVPVSRLSEQLNISRPAVTRSINQLEERGLVKRIESESDRRWVYVQLTDPGRAALKNSEECALQFTRGIYEELGMEDTEDFIRLLRRLAQYTTVYRTKPSGKEDLPQ